MKVLKNSIEYSSLSNEHFKVIYIKLLREHLELTLKHLDLLKLTHNIKTGNKQANNYNLLKETNKAWLNSNRTQPEKQYKEMFIKGIKA